MILYLYAIADGVADVSDLRGATGEPVIARPYDGLQIIVGEVDTPPPLDEASLTLQDRVVREVHARAQGALPMRFGAAFATAADVERVLAPRAATLRMQLAQVAGREQMTLRALRTPGSAAASPAPGTSTTPAVPPASGAEYLRGRAAEQQPTEIVPLLDALRPLVKATRLERGRTAGVIATVYHLIERGTAPAYLDAARAAAAALPDVSLRVSGPSPCYAFT